MSFWAELKRRNVVKVATAYIIVAWLIAQLVGVINDPLNLPDWFDTTVLVLLGLGLPIAVLFAWIFELTPQGLKVTNEVPLEQSIRHLTGQKLNYIVTGLLAAAVLFLVIDRMLDDRGPAVAAAPPSEPVAPPAPAVSVSATPVRQKVAVLPCDNLSPNADDSFFAAGIHEEILNQLAKIRSLLIVARSSVMQYAQNRPAVPQIARELNATAVLEWSVRYAGDDVLVTAQLIDPATDAHLWSDRYPGKHEQPRHDLRDASRHRDEHRECAGRGVLAGRAGSARGGSDGFAASLRTFPGGARSPAHDGAETRAARGVGSHRS